MQRRVPTLRLTIAAALIGGLAVAPAAAQTRTPASSTAAPTAAPAPSKLSIFGGFSIARDLSFGDPNPGYSLNMPGFAVGAEFTRSEKLSLLGEIGSNGHTVPSPDIFGTGATSGFPWRFTTVMGGARYYTRLSGHPKIRPFGQFMIGVFHRGNDWGNLFALQPGIGVMVPINEKLNFETHADWRTANHQWRFMSGVSFPLSLR